MDSRHPASQIYIVLASWPFLLTCEHHFEYGRKRSLEALSEVCAKQSLNLSVYLPLWLITQLENIRFAVCFLMV